MKKTIIISLIFLASAGTAFSQTIWSLSYEPATPVGEMRDFISESTLVGLNFSAGWYINSRISVGGSIQWTEFYEKNERHTWYFDGGAVTANAWKEYYIWSFYANAKYHFKDVEEEGRFVPYVGMSIGTMYINQNAQVGTYEFKEKSWRFAFAPEVGARIPMGLEQSWGFNFLIRYQMSIYEKNDINILQFLNYSVGVYWKMWPRGERY